MAEISSQSVSAYRVLARKYRPRTFEDLIGQEAMVRTLSNGFESGRIPQAWMLTGVRGVGKTTTARILARALNYKTPDINQPTIHMPVLGEHCQAIMDSRHVDVLEMDAASHTGIDDVRQIIEGVRYAPVSARYKVYIIDEVHMLSDKAFNAFLKTLEEPPPHAKFVFATTEIRKVPITILSRCQRFDLRRVEVEALKAHLSRLCNLEHVTAEDEALSLLARAAEGSVRDSLSLLDQAISHGAGLVKADTIRDMMGLADRTRVIDLFEAALKGDVPASFGILREQYEAGADPATILTDLASFTHLVTRLKLAPDASKDTALTEVERLRGKDFASRLSVPILSRTWQMLLSGVQEVQSSPRPLASAEMVLVKLAYASDLPAPDEVLKQLKERLHQTDQMPSSSAQVSSGQSFSAPSSFSASSKGSTAFAVEQAPQPSPALSFKTFADVVAMASEKRDVVLKDALERDVRLVRFEEGKIEFALNTNGRQSLANDLSRALSDWTGKRWMVAMSSDKGEDTIYEKAQRARQILKDDATQHPIVQSVLQQFPGSHIVEVRKKVDDISMTESSVAEDIIENDE